MFNTSTDLGRSVISGICALIVSATCVGVAVAPARAAHPQMVVEVIAAPATGLVGAVRY